MSLKPIFQILPPPLRDLIQSLPRTVLVSLEEIRIRQGRPLEIITSNETWFVNRSCHLSAQPKDSFLPSREECRRILNLISNHSIYAIEEELRRGYVTVEGGHRVGLAGKVIVERGHVKHIRDVTAFNIRIARQVVGVGEPLLPYLFAQHQVQNLLIVSPPQCGKTTMIRDLARLASTGGETFSARKVGIVDERSEIAGCMDGIPQHEVGPRTDVLDGCPKAEGMMMMIRSLSPEILVVDEIGRQEDSDAVHEAVYAGVHLIATVHGATLKEITHRPILSELIHEGVFSRIVILSRRLGPGTIETIYDRDQRPIERIHA